MSETIYSDQDAFFLEIQGVDFKIREPILWNKVEVSIERDLKKHGLDVNFPAKDSRLEFSDVPDEVSGARSKDLIDAVYNAKGSDGEIILKFGTFDGVTFTEITRQKIDLSSGYKNMLHTTLASATELTAKQRILDYYDAKVNMDDLRDVLGETLTGGTTPLTQEFINLHSQVLIKDTEQTNPNQTIFDGIEYDIDDGTFGDFKTYFIQYGFQEKIKLDGFEDFNIPNGISALDPVATLKATHRAEVSGTLVINPPTSIAANLFLDIGVGFNIIGNYTTFIKIGTQASQREFIIGSGVINFVTTAGQDIINTHGEVTVPLEILNVVKGDFLWMYTLVDISGGSGAKVSSVNYVQGFFTVPPAIFDQKFDQQIQMTFDSYASASVNAAHRLRDAIKYMFFVITGDNDTFVFDKFFDDDAPGFDFHYLNGYLLRSINEQNKRPSITAKDMFESVQLMWNLGENIEVSDTGEVTVVWEEVEHFYQDHEVLDLSDETANFSIESNKEASINTAKFSYPRLSVRETDGGGSIDAINTEIQSALPLEVARRKYNKRGKARTDGYDIETARRTSVVDKESVNTDEDPFVINTNNDVYTFGANLQFNEEFRTIEIFGAATFEAFRKVSRLDITGSASNNITITYDIDNLLVDGVSIKIVVNEELVDEALVSCTLTATGALSKQNEDFDKTVFVDGLTETAKDDNYNVILQPIRLLIQHSKWLNVSVFFKLKTLFYTTLKHLNADNFRSQLNASAVHTYGDIGKVEVTPQDNIAIEDCHEGKSIITPRKLVFEAEISRERFALLTQSARGQGAKPYGFISTRNNDGDKVSGWPLRVTGNPNENYYKLQLAEKGDFYG